MAKAHAQTGDYVRKDDELVMIESIDRRNQTYYTSDGGCMGFDEVTADNVFLESEVYGQLPTQLLSANH